MYKSLRGLVTEILFIFSYGRRSPVEQIYKFSLHLMQPASRYDFKVETSLAFLNMATADWAEPI
jgi:hypothetical protein